MISTLDISITRLLGISSMAILSAQASLLSLGFSASVTDFSLAAKNQNCVTCDMDDRLSHFTEPTDTSSKGNVIVSYRDHAQHFWKETNAGVKQFVSYTPKDCSDTDSDQTNNCGPADSTDAGTRMSG